MTIALAVLAALAASVAVVGRASWTAADVNTAGTGRLEQELGIPPLSR